MRDILTISKLNNYVKQIIQDDPYLSYVEVRGEIINLKRYATAVYFTLKEGDTARLSAVSFNIKAFPATLKDGDEVVASGRISVYEKSGTYQIICHDVSYYGLGAKLMALQALKVKLEKTGIFSADKKRKIPRFPKTIGIITPKDSAAQSDIITNINRRYPLATLKIINATFQGDIAPSSLMKAFRTLNDLNIDVMILARGGGSSDDLWAFNDEMLVMALSERKVPLISAIGHEIDTTLVDYIADLRASTPTAAAELSVPDQNELRQDLTNIEIRLQNAILGKYDLLHTSLVNLAKRPVLTNFNEIIKTIESSLLSLRTRLGAYSAKIINQSELTMRNQGVKLQQVILKRLNCQSEEVTFLSAKLLSLNPKNVLERGYAFITRDQEVIKNAAGLKTKDIINIQFSDGNARAEVIEGANHE